MTHPYPQFVSVNCDSDVRAWWPACVDYSPGDPGMSRDAATWAPQDGAA